MSRIHKPGVSKSNLSGIPSPLEESGRGRDASSPAPPHRSRVRHDRTGLLPGSTGRHPEGACRTRLSACDKRPRRCVRLLVSSATFPWPPFPSTCPAGPMGRPLSEGFRGTMKLSDSLHPYTWSCPVGSPYGPGGHSSGQMVASGFRTQCFGACQRSPTRQVRLRLAMTAYPL